MKRSGAMVMLVAFIAAGCGGGGSTPASTSTTVASTTSTAGSSTTSSSEPTSSTVRAATLAQRYAGLATTIDAAYATWHAEVLTAKLISQLLGPAATYASALSTFDHALAGIDASGKAESDVTALIAADNVVVGDLHSLSSTTAAGFVSWGARFESSGASAVAVSDTVRSDLGLTSATS